MKIESPAQKVIILLYIIGFVCMYTPYIKLVLVCIHVSLGNQSLTRIKAVAAIYISVLYQLSKSNDNSLVKASMMPRTRTFPKLRQRQMSGQEMEVTAFLIAFIF